MAIVADLNIRIFGRKERFFGEVERDAKFFNDVSFRTPSLSMAERNSTARDRITGVDQLRLPAQRIMSQLARARMTEQKIIMLASAKPLSARMFASI